MKSTAQIIQKFAKGGLDGLAPYFVTADSAEAALEMVRRYNGKLADIYF